jgi:hypothetical protein
MKRVLAILATWIAASSSAAMAQLPPEPPAVASEPVRDGAMPPVPLGEEPVDPYAVSNSKAGAKSFEGTQMLEAFHGREGIARVVDGLVHSQQTDPRLKDIFRTADFVRLKRVLNEQFCFI